MKPVDSRETGSSLFRKGHWEGPALANADILVYKEIMATSSETGERQDTKRLESKKQTLDDAYAAPANFLEIDVVNPETHGIGKKRYTDYEVRMRVGTY